MARTAHAAQVTLEEDHERLSALLQNTFCTHPAWRGLIRFTSLSGRQLCFFPVDNTARPDDAADRLHATNELRARIAAAISQQPHVRKLVPFAWLKLLERLRTCAPGAMTRMLGEVQAAAAECGVEAGHVELALLLFNELGLVMHHPEPALLDLVVLDPAAFLVEPASRVMCEHGTHHPQQHEQALREMARDYRMLLKEGRLSRGLLALLWRDREQDMPQLERLMVRYGLMLPVSGHFDGSGDAEEFIVPALLPRSEELKLPQLQSVRGAAGEAPALAARAVILFGVAEELGAGGSWQRRGWATAGEAARDGFLPGGLFEQVRCWGGAARWRRGRLDSLPVCAPRRALRSGAPADGREK